jgi:hypothetical protein
MPYVVLYINKSDIALIDMIIDLCTFWIVSYIRWRMKERYVKFGNDTIKVLPWNVYGKLHIL